MATRENSMIKAGFDISGENYEYNWIWLAPWINKGMRITHYTHIGLGGGNPYLEVEFPNHELAYEFACHLQDVGFLTDEEYKEFLEG